MILIGKFYLSVSRFHHNMEVKTVAQLTRLRLFNWI